MLLLRRHHFAPAASRLAGQLPSEPDADFYVRFDRAERPLWHVWFHGIMNWLNTFVLIGKIWFDIDGRADGENRQTLH